jgi:hypothetical protein
MDGRYVHRLSHKKVKRLRELLEHPIHDIELSTHPFSAMPLSMKLVTSFDNYTDSDWYIMGHVWDKIPNSLLFRIHLYPSDKSVIIECRCLHDKEKLFDRWYTWLIQHI